MESIADALGIRHDGNSWHRRAACKGMPLSLFFAERGSNHSAEPTVQEDRGKRICARCPVRRACLEETIGCESPQQTIARNAAQQQGAWFKAPRGERQLPIGVFGGTTPKERWADDIIHTDACPRRCECKANRFGTHDDDCRGDCKGCRPLRERVEILEGRLESQSKRFLLSSERMTTLG